MVYFTQAFVAIKNPTASSIDLLFSCGCGHSLGFPSRFLKNAIAGQLVQECYRSSKRLLDRISQNMFNTLEEHRKGHHVLELKLFKEAIEACNRFTV
jgi:hypothetical protein